MIVDTETADFAAMIERGLAELRQLGVVPVPAEIAAPVMSPLDPGFDQSEQINVPEDVATESPDKSDYIPNFERLSTSRKNILLRQQWLALQQAERALAPNFDRYKNLFVDAITDKRSAINATRTISPGMMRTVLLSFNQINHLMDLISRRVEQFGVTPPENWKADMETLLDKEDGDDET